MTTDWLRIEDCTYVLLCSRCCDIFKSCVQIKNSSKTLFIWSIRLNILQFQGLNIVTLMNNDIFMKENDILPMMSSIFLLEIENLHKLGKFHQCNYIQSCTAVTFKNVTTVRYACLLIDSHATYIHRNWIANPFSMHLILIHEFFIESR